MLFSDSRLLNRLGTLGGRFSKNLLGGSRHRGHRHYGQSSTLRRFGLNIEPLEDRRMLSVVGLDIHFYEDTGSGVGDEITVDTIEAGTSFYVQITAEDLRTTYTTQGITQLTVTVNWAPAFITELDAAAFVNMDDPLITAAFSKDRGGSLNNGSGLIFELTGSVDPGNSSDHEIGASGPEEFSLLHFQALTSLGSAFIDVVGDSATFADGETASGTTTDFENDDKTFSVIENSSNTAPTADDVSLSTDEDTIIDDSLLAYASDPDEGDTLTFSTDSATSTQGASVTVNADGSFTYDPTGSAAFQLIAAGEPLVDTFSYTVTDSFGATSTATVTVTVGGINDAPEAENTDTIHIKQDLAFEIDLRDYAWDWETLDDDLIFTLKTPTNGMVEMDGDYTAVFTPTSGFLGLASFTFDVTDTGSGTDAAATTEMTIELAVDNSPPQLDDATAAETSENTAVTIDLWDRVSDAQTDNADLIFDITNSTGGEAVLQSDGHTVIFNPTTGFSGTATFTFTVTDETTGPQDPYTEEFTLEVTVNDVNQLPQAEDTSVVTTDEDTWVTIDLWDRVSDAETADADLAFALTDNASDQAVLQDDGHTVKFSPTANFNGSTSFTFEVTDTAESPLEPNTVQMTVDVEVAAVNDTPRSEETANVETQEDTEVTIDLWDRVIDVETADADLAFTLTDDAGGQAVLQSDGHTVIFKPADNFNGSTSFTFEVTDTAESPLEPKTVEMTVNVDVTAVNDAPEAEGDLTVSAQEDTVKSIDLWDYVTDVETADADLTFDLTDTAYGRAVLQGDGHTVVFTPDENFNGEISFSFSATDDDTTNAQESEFTITVNFAAVNDDPVAVDDSAVTNVDVAIDTSTSTVNLGVLQNDSDVDGDTLTVTAADTASAYGAAVTVNEDGSYTYDPTSVSAFDTLAPGECLDDTFSYTVSDGNGGTATATVTVTVYATASEAVALDDTAETDEDTSATGNVLDNDNIASAGLTLTVIAYDATSDKGASVTINTDGSFTYDPSGVNEFQALAVGETATDTFTYTIEDGNGNTDTATVTVTITGTNDAPTAVNDATTVSANTISKGNVRDNDTDPDTNDVLTVVPISGTTEHGASYYILENGDFGYNPTESDELTALSSGTVTDEIIYEISDGHGGTSTAKLTITVKCVNDSPDAVDDTAETDADTAVTGNVLENDSDVDTGDILTADAKTGTTSNGATYQILSNGTFTYDPSDSETLKALAPGETIDDTFTYTARDSGGLICTATVTVTVTGVDDPPTADDDTGATDEDTVLTGSGLFDNDVEHDPDDSFSLVGFDTVSTKGATVTVNTDGSYTYDPTSSDELQSLATDETTTDTFTYTIEDQQGNTSTATVTLTLTGVNDAPTAVDDEATTNKDTIASGNVLTNDIDPDTSDTLTVVAATGTTSKGATFEILADGTFTYDPSNSTTLQDLEAGETTTDTFTYTIGDGSGNTSTATVTITISGDEGVPIANDDEAETDENTILTGNVLDNDQVPTGRTLTVTDYDATSERGANVVVAADGTFTYYPASSSTLNALAAGDSLTDTFEYTISDGAGNTDTATVTITVTGISDLPTLAVNTGKAVPLGETVTIGKDSLQTTDPDTDAEDLIYTITELPGDGTLKNNGTALAAGDTFTQEDIDNGYITYTHDGDAVSTDEFKFTVSDGDNTLGEATFSFTLAGNSLSGFVYVDMDNDGVKDAGEVGLGSVNVVLTGVDSLGNAVAQSTWTAADGSYAFDEVPAGTVELSIVQPDNFVGGKETAGSLGGTVANDRIVEIDLEADETGTGYNFGQSGLQKQFISRRLFLSSTPAVSVVFQGAVGSSKTAVAPSSDPTVSLVGNTVTVTGTDGDDTVEFHAGESQHTLVVNGQSYSYAAADVTDFDFNMGAGTDFVTIYGTDNDETAVMQAGAATFSGDNLEVSVTESERILIDAADGDDEVTLYDSPGDDSLRADDIFAVISGHDFVDWAFNFESATAKSSTGHDTNDTGTLTDLVLATEGSWTAL